MPNLTVGVQWLRVRLRRDLAGRSSRAVSFHRRNVVALQSLRARLSTTPEAAVRPAEVPAAQHARRPRPGAHPRSVLDMLRDTPRSVGRWAVRLSSGSANAGAAMLSRERILPVAVSVLVLVASALSVAPPGQVRGGGPEAPATPRIAIAGAQVALPPVDRPGTGGTFGGSLDGPAGAFDGPAGAFDGPAGAVGGLGAVADVSTIEEAAGDSGARRLSAIEAQITAKSGSPLVEDGTLLKPVVVDPTVADGAATIDTYRVRAGDTLTGIARRYGVSMMTLWWANDLKSKDDLHVGQVLRVPPVNGLVWAVKEGQTLAGVAKTTGIEADTIVAFNGLEDETLVAGQTLIIPGARGKSIPIPKPQPVRSGAGRSGTVSAVRPPVRYSGGRFAWPVLGGRISQYFHYGHYGIDIAANYGTSIRSVAAGTVTYAGWRSNGGGYQVWLAHGSGLYTAYYHMAGVSVVRGQSVARGQRIGRIGCSGWCTGPHTHFEVWIGPVMNGGYRVNPLRYL